MLIAQTITIAAATIAQCNGQSPHRVHVNWSERVNIASPNRTLFLKTAPDFKSEENNTAVILGACSSKREERIYTLTRSAEFRWSPDSLHLLLIDHPTADDYKITIFYLRNKNSGIEVRQSNKIDQELNASINKRLPLGSKLISYRPTSIRWEGQTLELLLSGAYGDGDFGRLKSFCYTAAVSPAVNAVMRISKSTRCEK